jgi:hypothetical protein
MSNCRGCGSLLDLTKEEVSQAVDELLEATRTDGTPKAGVCPLCGHATVAPVSHRKTVVFALLLALVVVVAGVAFTYYARLDTERNQVTQEALRRLQSNEDATRQLGAPIIVHGEIVGQVKEDETGWQEARLRVPVRGPGGAGTLQVVGGRSKGEWQFTTIEVIVPAARRRIDLITGRVVELDPKAYVEVHTQAAAAPEYTRADLLPPRWDGEFPCVSISGPFGGEPRVGACPMTASMGAPGQEAVDRFEIDLRFGKFIVRQTDLELKDGDLRIPFTRCYTA